MLDHIQAQLEDKSLDLMALQAVAFNYTLNWHFVYLAGVKGAVTISKHDHEVLQSAMGEIETAQGVKFQEVYV